MPGTAARQDFQNMLAGFAQLDRVMKQKQDDELYNKMLDQLDPGKQHHGGKIEYQGYQQQQTQADVHLLRQAQLEAAMRRNTGGNDLTRFQQESLQLRRENQDRLNRGNNKQPSWRKTDSEVEAATGAHLRDWMGSDPSTHKFVNPQGQGDNNGQIFSADYKDATGTTQHLRAPRAYYDAALHSAMNNGAQGGAPDAGPSLLSPSLPQGTSAPGLDDYGHSIPGATSSSTTPTRSPAQMAQDSGGDSPGTVAAEYKARKITPEQAKARLKALGFAE